MVGSQCMLIIAMGIKGASSLEIALLNLQMPPLYAQNRTFAFNSEVRLTIDLAN